MTTENNATKTNSSTPAAISSLPVKTDAQPVIVKKIGKTTYRVKLHFSETSKETMSDKIKRLILNDCEKDFEQTEKISQTPLTKRIRRYRPRFDGECWKGRYA